jgi:hypothetical protein
VYTQSADEEINKPKKKSKNKNNKKVLVFYYFFQKEKKCYPCFASEVRTRSTNPVQEITNDKINQKHTPIMKKKQDEAIEVLRKFELKTEITRITGKKTTKIHQRRKLKT